MDVMARINVGSKRYRCNFAPTCLMLIAALFVCLSGCSGGSNFVSLPVRKAGATTRTNAGNFQRSDQGLNLPGSLVPREVPLLIAADIALQQVAAAPCPTPGPDGSHFGRLVRLLDGRLRRRVVNFSFIDREWFVQSAAVGSFAGRPKPAGETLRQAGVRLRSIAFITSPIKSFDNRTLIIVSELPYRVTIVSVNRHLRVRRLFDSDRKRPIFLRRVPVGMGPLYEVRVVKPDVFLLYEGAVAGWPETAGGRHGFAGRYTYARHVRVFTVDFPHGHFRIRLRSRRSR